MAVIPVNVGDNMSVNFSQFCVHVVCVIFHPPYLLSWLMLGKIEDLTKLSMFHVSMTSY